ncbi:MAG TPA: hypothetical protein VFG72_02960 [Marmoricola sp.]|nr:hypothetical protein [Marmoricola sp.]
MADVLLVTCSAFPDGEVGGAALLDEFAARGVSACWAAWDDPQVAWDEARLVAVRSPWDYEQRREEFLGWARSVEPTTQLVNAARVLEWNTDKLYLRDLATTTLPVVPTLCADDEGELAPAIATFGTAVVKPRVGASGRGVVVFDGRPGGPPSLDESQLVPGPWVVQPLVESIRTEGETSVFVFGGEPVSAVRKLPGGREIRVHEEYGGRTAPTVLSEDVASLARRTVAEGARLLDVELPYARVDLMRLADGTLAVSELEVTEPGLYLDVVPGNAEPYVEAMVALLS